MNVDIYSSPFITANSALTYINPLEIEYYCNGLKQEIEQLIRIRDLLLEAKGYASKENFYMEGINIEEKLDLNSINIQKTINYIDDYIMIVKNALYNAIDDKQIELNELAKEEERRILLQGGLFHE